MLVIHIPATLTDQVTQRCWSKYRRYPFRSLLRSREMLIGKICTPNLVSLAGPSPFSEAITNNACKSTRQACAMVQQIMISHYATRGANAVRFSWHSGIPYAPTVL